ncbi:zinc-binding oxidoreductase CipB [Xylaria arbuscula]|nr:zinc-binding oxidoreductase CipB [Xylaria arbuscula]
MPFKCSGLVRSHPRLAPLTYLHSQSRTSAMTLGNNTAAFLTEAKAHPFVVGVAPLWTPGANEILVKNEAVASNPVDGNLQYMAIYPLNYPTVLGQDIAGLVAAVGPEVTRFQVGDRVVGHATSMISGRQQDGGFQLYKILQTNMASHIPTSVPYEMAVVLPLGLSTAAAALFQKACLNLQLQLAIAAGYEVITTASPRNFDYVKKLGTSQAFDYNSPTVSEELLTTLEPKILAGATCVNVALKSRGNKFVATTKRGFPDPPEGITLQVVFRLTIRDDEISRVIYEEFLPKALKEGSYKTRPEPLVVSKGLKSVQAAVDLQRAGVSAQKIAAKL